MPDDAIKTLPVSEAPPKVREAFAHVRAAFPQVSEVIYVIDDDGFDGWRYTSASEMMPTFDDRIQVSLLEDALDEAWEHHTFPVRFAEPRHS